MKPEDLQITSGEAVRTVRTKSAKGRYTVLLRTPEWATEQTEHSWLGSFELSVWTWTAWTTPTNVTRRTHNKDTAAMQLSLRDLYSAEIK
jgi:hypothetical protein